MTYQLKIKYKELTGEAQANKLECKKMLKRARRGHVPEKKLERPLSLMKQIGAEMNLIPEGEKGVSEEWNEKFSKLFAIYKTIKKLKAERAKNPCPEWKQTQLRHDAADCRQHRIDVVRPHARATHIAYCYLRGRDFKEIEQKSDISTIMWDQVARMVYKYGSIGQRTAFPAWLADIGLHVDVIPVPNKPLQFNYRVTPLLKQAA